MKRLPMAGLLCLAISVLVLMSDNSRATTWLENYGDIYNGNSSGKVGIGTNTPSGLLSVTGSNGSKSQVWLGSDQNGNMLTMDFAINSGLANIVAGAYWDYQGGAGGYKYGGTRGASRIFFDDGALHFYTGQQSGTAGASVPFTERLTICNNGDVGIGTNSPRGLLSVIGTNSNVSQLWLGTDQAGSMLTMDCSISAGLANIVAGAYWDNAAGGYKYGGTRGASRIYLNDGSLHFFTGGTSGTAGGAVPFSERITILNDGRVGIATSNPGTFLDVKYNHSETNPATLSNPNVIIRNDNTTNGNYALLEFRSKDTSGVDRCGAGIAGVFSSRSASMVQTEQLFDQESKWSHK